MTRGTVLVTGMSGTGKSSALVELGRRGHAVLDTDDPGWKYLDPVTGEQLWDLPRLQAFLDARRPGSLFVAGCVVNQGRLYDRFDAVVLLSAPLEVVLGRVVDRSNPFGSSAADRRRITADLQQFQAILRSGATHEIDTTASLADVVAQLERIAGPT